MLLESRRNIPEKTLILPLPVGGALGSGLLPQSACDCLLSRVLTQLPKDPAQVLQGQSMQQSRGRVCSPRRPEPEPLSLGFLLLKVGSQYVS